MRSGQISALCSAEYPVGIEQVIRDRALTEKDMLPALNREIAPVARALRQRMNLILGVPFIVSSSMGVLALDWTKNRHYAVPLTEDITSIIFTNPADAGADYCVRFDQSAAFTVAGWPDTVRFVRGAVPTITPIAGSSDLFQMFYDGSDYWTEISQDHR